MTSFSGPHFTSFYQKQNFEYALEYFKKAMKGGTWRVSPCEKWADDKWWLHQDDRTFYPNNGWKVVQAGIAGGRIVGGNLSTLAILQGTEYMPQLKDSVLFLEETSISEDGRDETFGFFLRQLGGLTRQDGFGGVRGIVIGRFHKEANVTDEHLRYIAESHPKLKNIPIIANVDFGHTTPIFTFPIGGRCRFDASENGAISLELSA
jgi:muramoyltetrapeptide carboxypeptidase LdcA involved in peptidoglycan recycling